MCIPTCGSFLSPAAASQLTCYLLHLVHEIILSAAIDDVSQSTSASQSTSIVSAARALDDNTVASHSSTASTCIDFSAQPQPSSSKSTPLGGARRGRYARGIAMLNADITTIVVLREFLMHGVGGRILEVLLMIDTTVSEIWYSITNYRWYNANFAVHTEHAVCS